VWHSAAVRVRPAAVFRDIRRGVEHGALVPLVKDTISRFSAVEGPRGERLFAWDGGRVERFLWKVTRGLYTLVDSRVLAEGTRKAIWLVPPGKNPTDLTALGWYPAVRDTPPLPRYGAVFDYKWIGLENCGE
jgi:hypothetical protein